MAGKNKTDFLARLERLEDEKKSQTKSASQTVRRRGKGGGAGWRILWGLLAILVVIGIGAVVLSYKDFKYDKLAGLRSFVGSQQERFAGMLDANSQVLAPLENQLKARKQPKKDGVIFDVAQFGYLIHSPGVLTQDGTQVLVTDIVSGFQQTDISQAPRVVTQVGRGPWCRSRKPTAAQKVHSVSLDYGLSETQVQMIQDDSIIKKMHKYLETFNARQSKRPPDISDFLAQGNIASVDVFVTDATAPAFLILQANQGPMIWNVQVADDVEIAHIAVISRAPVGLILPDTNTSFEFVKIGGFGRQHYDYATHGHKKDFQLTDDPRDQCRVNPIRKPKEHWDQWQQANRSDGADRNQRNTYFALHELYDEWFVDQYGVSSEQGILGAEGAAHVLVGPVPAQKIAYQKFAGAKINLTPSDHIFFGDGATRKAKTLALHQDVISLAAPGGVQNIRPDIMEASK